MKKEYKKPLISIEAFALSQSIAKNCGSAYLQDDSIGYPNFQDIDTCGWVYTEGGEDDPFGDSSVTTEEITYIYWQNSNCNAPAGDDFVIGGYCYNNPGGGTGIFGSA